MNERADGETRLWEFTIMNDYHDLNDWLIVTGANPGPLRELPTMQ